MEQTSGPLRVYIVEDSSILGDLLERTVEAAGGQLVGRTGDAAVAISALRELAADLVILDIMLADGSGFDVLNALNDAGPAHDAYKMVLTNHADARYRSQSFLLGADCFFDKSTEAWQAVELINRLAAFWPTRGSERPPTQWLCPGHGP